MKSIPEFSIDARALYECLKQSQIGEVVTYADLSRLIGRDVQRKYRHLLTSACRRCLGDDMVVECVHGIGVKRLADTEIIGVGEHALPKIRRLANRVSRKLNAIHDFDALPNAEKVKLNASRSLMGAFSYLTKAPQVARVEKQTAATHAALPLQRTLQIFTSE